MNIQDFESHYITQLNDTQKVGFRCFCQNMMKADRANVNFGSDLILDYIFNTENSSLSYSKFFRIKGFAIMFYTWMIQNGYIDQSALSWISALNYDSVAQSENIEDLYFKDINTVLNYIDMVADYSGIYAAYRFINIKSIILLAWYGYKIEDMVNIKKSQVINHEYLQIPQEYMQVLRDFTLVTDVSDIQGGRSAKYVPSQYLFRSSTNEMVTSNSLRALIKDFNKLAKGFGKMLSLKNLRKNKILCDIYKIREQSNFTRPTQEIVNMIMNTDKAVKSEYSRLYNIFEKTIMGVN